MILEALKRWFRPAAPSKPDLDAIGESILAQLRSNGMIPADAQVRVRRLPFPTVDPEPASSWLQAGIKPPDDAEAEGWTWERWSGEMRSAGGVPGWSFCRFANRLGDDEVAFVFGFARGSFGIWQQPYTICRDFASVQESTLLTSITHLPSGMGMGIFAEREVAASACELAERASEWSSIFAHGPAMDIAIERTRAAWEGVGIVPCTNAHAHAEPGGPMLNIIGRSAESIEAGRPEKLS